MAGEERPLVPVAAVFGLGIAAGLPYLGGGPVWDDHRLIVDHLGQLDATGVLGLWTAPVGLGAAGASYYRPLAMSLLALAAPLGFGALHLLSAALHAGSAALLYQLGGRRPWALLGAVFFASHPVASEVLGWASALPDALSLFLGLAAVALAPQSIGGAALLALGAGLSKETGLLLLPAGILAGLAPKRSWSAAAFALGGALLLRLLVGVGADWQLDGKLGMAPLALGWAWSSLAIPFPLGAVRDLLAAPAWLLPVGLLVLGGLLAAARRSETGKGAALLLLLGPMAALGPTLSGNLGAWRYSYVALAGVALGLGGVRLSVRPSLIAQVGLVGLVMQLVLAPQWRDDLALFGAATAAAPGSSYAWHFLGGARLQAGDLPGAAQAFEEAVATGHPHPADASYALIALEESGQVEAALAWARAHREDGLDAEALARWARAAVAAGEVAEAAQVIEALRRPDGGLDGPSWVGSLAASLPAP